MAVTKAGRAQSDSGDHGQTAGPGSKAAAGRAQGDGDRGRQGKHAWTEHVDLVWTQHVWSCPVLKIRYEGGKKGSPKRNSMGVDYQKWSRPELEF